MSNDLAQALILATQYIATRRSDATSDDDIRQLEDIAFLISQATKSEKTSLVRVATDLGFPDWSDQIGIGDR